MRSLAFLVTGFFLIYSIQSPRAVAGGGPVTAANFSIQLSEIGDSLEDLGFRFRDESKRPMTAEAFFEKPPTDFYLTLPETELPGLTLHLQTNASKGIGRIVITAQNEEGKVLSRRSLSIDPRDKDAKATSLLLRQTAHSMHKQIEKVTAVRTALRSFFAPLRTALFNVFGIPPAHAGELTNRGLQLLFTGLLTICVACLPALVAAQFQGASRIVTVPLTVVVATAGFGAILYGIVGILRETIKEMNDAW